MSRSALERQATRAARSGLLPTPTSDPAGFLSGVDEITEEQAEQEEARNNVLPIHGNDRTFNLNTLLAQTILASDYFKGLAGVNTYLEVGMNENTCHVVRGALAQRLFISGTQRVSLR